MLCIYIVYFQICFILSTTKDSNGMERCKVSKFYSVTALMGHCAKLSSGKIYSVCFLKLFSICKPCNWNHFFSCFITISNTDIDTCLLLSNFMIFILSTFNFFFTIFSARQRHCNAILKVVTSRMIHNHSSTISSYYRLELWIDR